MVSKIVFTYLSLVCIQELYQYDMFLVMKNNTFVRNIDKINKIFKPKFYPLKNEILEFANSI